MRFLAWYEREEQAPLQLSTPTPITVIGYRNHLQHEQHKSISTINLQVSALRIWYSWLTEQGYLAADPAAHIKLVGGETSSSRKGLKSAQVNALLRQAQLSRDLAGNYAIGQVLLQTSIVLYWPINMNPRDKYTILFRKRVEFIRAFQCIQLMTIRKT